MSNRPWLIRAGSALAAIGFLLCLLGGDPYTFGEHGLLGVLGFLFLLLGLGLGGAFTRD
jgi:hypothetical protein